MIESFGHGGRVFSNKDWKYVVVPKCASSIIIETLKLKERKNTKANKSFTFIRLPFARLKSYLYQKDCFTEKQTEEKVKSIINNFDGFDEHCVPYSLYIKKDNFNFIGTLENFYEDWKNISNIHIEHMTERQNFDNKVQKDLKTKKFVKVDNKKIEDIHNVVIKKYSNDLSRLYSGDFALYSKVIK